MATQSRAKADAYAAYCRQRSENIKAIIAELKSRNHMTDAQIAKAMNLKHGTFVDRKSDPSKFRMRDIWMLYEALNVPEEQRKTIV